MNKMPLFSEKDIHRFWTKTAMTANSNKCWNWTASKDKNGYGKISYPTSNYLSSRVSYFLSNNKDPYPFLVCHTCDNPACVNPNHLFLGTQKDNVEDMINKGRQTKNDGEKSGSNKFTNEHVLEMRRLNSEGISRIEIINIFGISQCHLSGIINRKFWKHI